MGEVYRAMDTNLGRQVAIKVLPDGFAQDAERLARFEREAKTLASLSHPNIAIIHGLERASSSTVAGQAAVHALVMELVEGQTLADRIAEGPMPYDDALGVAGQIADALEAAHEQGIVHRDLKPANIKVRADGTVKVLDFGLAKAVEPVGGARSGLTQSPTITSPVMTVAGMLLGTASYMSPEQARARPVDKRTDIWAFGAVLYEMLSGRRAFAGDDVSEVLASVLAREPDWTALPDGLPPAVGNTIKRCLHKDRHQRFRDIGDVSLAMKGAFDTLAPHVAHAAIPPRPLWRRALPVAVTAVAAVTITGLAVWSMRPRVESPPVTMFDYALPPGQEFATTQRPLVAISRDGRSFAYQTPEGLYVRPMGDLTARLVSGTADVRTTPFFSPDGQWVGYWATGGMRRGLTDAATGQLKKVAVSGGAAVTLCEAGFPSGASWSPDNTILFADRAGIGRVAANGGTPEVLIQARDGEQFLGPQLLPGGRSVLFSVTTGMGPDRWSQAQIVVQSLDSGQRTVVVQGGSDARYLATGHLVYAVRDGVFGIAFDAKRLTTTGGAVPLVQGVRRPVGVNAAALNYAVSDAGTLVYITGMVPSQSLVWVDRNGTASPIAAIPPGSYEDPRLSPDGGRVLLTRDGDIWIYEIASGRSHRVSRDGSSLMGVWDPAGSQVAYSSASKGNLEAWVTAADGSGQPRQLTHVGGQVHVDSWSPDGRTLSFHHHSPEGPIQILMLPMQGSEQKPQVFLEEETGAEGCGLFARRALRGIPLERDRSERNLHSSVSRTRRSRHGLGRRWTRADVEGAHNLLPKPEWRSDVRRVGRDGADAEGWRSRAAVRGAVLRFAGRIAAAAV